MTVIFFLELSVYMHIERVITIYAGKTLPLTINYTVPILWPLSETAASRCSYC